MGGLKVVEIWGEETHVDEKKGVGGGDKGWVPHAKKKKILFF